MKWIHQKNLQNKPLREMKWKMYRNDSMYRSVCIKCPNPPSPTHAPIPIPTNSKPRIGIGASLYSHNSIGTIYHQKGDYERALELYK